MFEQAFSTRGKTALVTGGASGIGRMVSEALARSGADVIIASRKSEQCEEAAAAINALDLEGKARGIGGDVGSEAGIARLCGTVEGLTDRLDILVNNSGKTWGAPLEDFPYEAWGSVLAVNLTAPFVLTQRLLPLMRSAADVRDPARIINIGSMVGTMPIADGAYSYAASKAAVHHLTRMLAAELASLSITVNAIAPGIFESRMTAFATMDETKRKAIVSSIPLGRLGAPGDIAGLVHLLCGQAGAYITGAIIPLDGGLAILPPSRLFD